MRTLAGVAWLVLATPSPAATLDEVRFGEAVSEQAHQVAATDSEAIKGGLGEPARRLLPRAREQWEGGTVSFLLKCDPAAPNYVTIRLWGSDVNENRLLLYVEGKQIGYRHLGDIDTLDLGSPEPALPGRFFYRTSPLPETLTHEKTELHLEVRSTGRIWNYGRTFEEFQRPMKTPSRGLYRICTHTEGCFVPAPGETQGEAPTAAPVRQAPGPEVLEALKAAVNKTLTNLLAPKRTASQMEAQFLARAYFMEWTVARAEPKAVEKVAQSVDALYAAWKADPKAMLEDKTTPNPGWFAAGPAAEAVRLLAGPLAPRLEEMLADGTPRRAAWLALFEASRDFLRRNRKFYTNQTMIGDLNFYRSHNAVRALAPERALPEEQALSCVRQAVGLEPWLGSDTPNGPERRAGEGYYQLTRKGLSRELGYVGNYGEVLDWATQIYDATRPSPGEPGDGPIRAQLARIAEARAPFRYPALDEEGHRAMRLETTIGWRDTEYPGMIAYDEPERRDGSPFYSAAATLDPAAVGRCQQMLEDHQFFAALQRMMHERGLVNIMGTLGAPEEYRLLAAQPPQKTRLPMTPGQPDFVFTDEENGVVALKHGEEILYVSLYWRAGEGINRLARVHDILPRYERIAVVAEEARFEESGKTWTRPDWTNFFFAGGGFKYPGGLHSAHAGEAAGAEAAGGGEGLQRRRRRAISRPRGFLPGAVRPVFHRDEYERGERSAHGGAGRRLQPGLRKGIGRGN